MGDRPSILSDIRRAFTSTAMAFRDQLFAITPCESPYALLFEIDDQNPGAWPIGATEESLTRLVDQYFAKGYRASNGNHHEMLRTGLRWDAPGDNMVSWYWGAEDDFRDLNLLIKSAFDQNAVSDHTEIRDLCLEALKQLDSQHAFGTGEARARLTIGISNVDYPFEAFLDELAKVNPPTVISRLRTELAAYQQVWNQIERSAR